MSALFSVATFVALAAAVSLTLWLRGQGLSLFWAWTAAVNGVTLSLYAWDKLRAITGTWRVPVAGLWLFTLSGGFVGALLGMLLVRHKSQQDMFYVAVVIGAIVWVGVLGYVERVS